MGEGPPLPEVPFKTMAVAPGDQIEASVGEQTDGSWVTRVDDLTTGISGVMVIASDSADWGTRLDSDPSAWYQEEGYGEAISYTGGYTAKWILEDYSLCSSTSSCSPAPFAAYGTVAFGSLSVNNAAPDLTQAVPDGIVQNGVPLSVPTPLTATGLSVVRTAERPDVTQLGPAAAVASRP